jgi:hypothetical protein
VPLAANCKVDSAATEVAEPELETAIETSVGGGGVCVFLLLPPPHPTKPKQISKSETAKTPTFFISSSFSSQLH